MMSINDLQIAFITGRSNPNSCLLSPLQSAFIQRLAAPGRRLIMCNFPYTENDCDIYRIQSLPKRAITMRVSIYSLVR